MSNQVKLMLRPPPNVDFVHGYPGIPPGAPDRPQASVQGEVEVRVGANGVKAKWVRIELRKVETLPGGGPNNEFYDFVGPSPITLWSAGDEEYQSLTGANYPFSIRIPESIPPSISLDNRAGIKYELLASVCVKGKKKLLRSAKSTVVSHVAPIIIDKHDLHSTWPVYCQYDSRQVEQNGVTLLVERNHTCYGPGDRVTVSATVKSQSVHTVIVRGFEFALEELSIFRAGAPIAGKKTGTQTKQAIVDESKLPVNATLYGGMQHKAELGLNISPRHTTTTLNAARHIDITYKLRVKALLGTGEQLLIELPVIISNWQRQVSEEAVKRIGPAPSLSLTQPASPTNATNPMAQTFNGRTSPEKVLSGASSFATVPNGHMQTNGHNEFGLLKTNQTPGILADELGPSRPAQTAQQQQIARTNVFQREEFASPVPASASVGLNGRRPPSARSTETNRETRFTVTNALPSERKQWMSAEEEKAKLYSEARDKVDRIQGTAPKPISSPAPKSSASTPWPTAEEEKAKLFNEAKKTAERNQGRVFDNPTGPTSTPSLNASSASSSSTPKSAAAAMYAGAMASRSANAPPAPGITTPAPQPAPSPSAAKPLYMSAEEEKAQLKRYHEAKMAVERTQGLAASSSAPVASPSHRTAQRTPSPPPPSGAPIPYESLYSQPATSSDMPPSFAASTNGAGGFDPNLSEKERVRRAYDAQDSAAIAGPPPPADAPAYTPPPPRGPIVGKEILSEKERLRRKYEEEDRLAAAAAAARASPPSPAPPPSSQAPPYSARPKPSPPAGGSSSRLLTAEEEKAQLRAKYSSQENGSPPPPPPVPMPNGRSQSVRLTGIPPPPPLMPRPPADYIQETREEDARVSRYVNSDVPGYLDEAMPRSVPPLPPKPSSSM